MRNTLLGVVAGLIVGAAGALAYTHYLGEGQDLVKAQSDLATAQASLAKVPLDENALKDETDALNKQVQQLSAENDALTKQAAAPPPPAVAAAPANPMAGMADMMKAGITMRFKQKMVALKARLHLTPEQEEAVQAAMDAEEKQMEGMFKDGKFNPQAIADLRSNKTLDQTMDTILTPDQKTEYTQMETDEKSSQAETMATLQMNQMEPALNLSDTQKDQVYSALTQANLDMANQNTPIDPSNPGATLDAREQATEAALAKVLTPDQMATYHQQQQSQIEMQKAMMQKFMQGGGGGNIVIAPGSGAPPPPPGP